ncbi:pentapeptide repeat-containing protein [Lentzea sp. NPDC003310]|uniref:pentapeptide repeat-containing protein n=1 Tax=Lentzea sp. NPDC003310 TaxID=3154447 RepID=UPI0033B10629
MDVTVRARAVAIGRPIAYVLGGLLAITLYGLAIWQAPEFLVNRDVLSRATPEQRLPAEHNARLIVISVGGALVVGTGLLYTARNYRLAHRGQVTERFTKALERLGSDELYVRIGGVHALEHVMRDSPEHRGDVVKVLVAFIRDRLPRRGTEAANETPWMHPPSGSDEPELPAEPAPDVQAALTALGSRPEQTKHNRASLNFRQLHVQGVQLSGAQFRKADLRGADLRNADLFEADLQNADLSGANLQNAYLSEANLQNTNLSEANLQNANLSGANLQNANLHGADLQNTHLFGADLQNARLSGADLQNADLREANLQKARLRGADLQKADLRKANLQSTHLRGANLQKADLHGANLQNADLHGTNLSLASLTAEQLRQAALSEHTILPEGLARGPLGEIWEKNLS